MVYLGPIEPRSVRVKNPHSPSEVRAVTQSTASHGIGEGEEIPVHLRPGFVERRKQDRRQASRAPLLETRAGKDRRQSSQGSINILV